MMYPKKLTWFLFVAALPNVACTETKEKNKEVAENKTTVITEKLALSQSDNAIKDRAITALNVHLDMNIDGTSAELYVVSIERKDWANPSLGCPKPGFMYPQVIVPGHLVRLTYKGKPYAVNMSDKHAIICAENMKTIGTTKNGSTLSKEKDILKVENILKKSRHDFSEKTNIPEDDIKTISVRPTLWSNHALGCPKLGRTYKEEKVKGFQIILEARGRQYTYHSDDDDKTIACPEIATH